MNSNGGGGGGRMGEFINHGPLTNNGGTIAGATTISTISITPTPLSVPTSSKQTSPALTPKLRVTDGESTKGRQIFSAPTENTTSKIPTANNLLAQIGGYNFWSNWWTWLVTMAIVSSVICFLARKIIKKQR